MQYEYPWIKLTTSLHIYPRASNVYSCQWQPYSWFMSSVALYVPRKFKLIKIKPNKLYDIWNQGRTLKFQIVLQNAFQTVGLILLMIRRANTFTVMIPLRTLARTYKLWELQIEHESRLGSKIQDSNTIYSWNNTANSTKSVFFF